MKMKNLLSETKLFHFHGISKNLGGGWSEPLDTPLDPPLCLLLPGVDLGNNLQLCQSETTVTLCPSGSVAIMLNHFIFIAINGKENKFEPKPYI